MNKIFLVATIAFGLSACSARVADLTLASTKNININSAGFINIGRTEGSDMVPIVLFPLGSPSVKEAVDNAIENNNCAVGLTDVVVDQEFFSFFFGYIAFIVEGNLIVDSTVKGCEKYASKNFEVPTYINKSSIDDEWNNDENEF